MMMNLYGSKDYFTINKNGSPNFKFHQIPYLRNLLLLLKLSPCGIIFLLI